MPANSKVPLARVDQDTQARNRAQLRELVSKIDNDHEELTSVTSNALAEVQCKANEMFEISKQEARSAALDANLLHGVSRLGAEQAGKLDKQSPEEFVKKLLLKYGMGMLDRGQKLNFPVLARDLETEGIFRTVPSATFILDSKWAPAAPKERKQRQKRDRTTEEECQTANTVAIKDLQEQDGSKAQTSRMDTMYEVIKQRAGPQEKDAVHLFRLLLHPTSFSQTVENFFDLAFLVKDGKVAMEVDGGCPFVKVARMPETDAYEKGLIKVQNILKLDHATYLQLVDRWCKEGGPYLPDRGEEGGRASKAARG